MTATHQTELPDKIDGAVLKVAGVVVLGAVMSILDITVVNVALPTFAKEFSTPENPVSYAHVAWTVTAYTLALATVIPMSGWAANRFGTKRLYMLALLLFTMGSALCATAWTINHPDEAWAVFKATDPALDDELNHRAWLATLPRLAHRPAALDHGRYQRFAAFLAARGLIDGQPPVATYAVDLFEEPKS